MLHLPLRGMAAVQLICNLFQPGDEILVAFDLYGGTFRLFDFYENNMVSNLNMLISKL